MSHGPVRGGLPDSATPLDPELLEPLPEPELLAAPELLLEPALPLDAELLEAPLDPELSVDPDSPELPLAPLLPSIPEAVPLLVAAPPAFEEELEERSPEEPQE